MSKSLNSGLRLFSIILLALGVFIKPGNATEEEQEQEQPQEQVSEEETQQAITYVMIGMNHEDNSSQNCCMA